MEQSRCVCRSYRCRLSVLFIIYSINQTDFPLFFYCISFILLTPSRRWLPCCFPVKARLWFTLAHTSSQIGLPTNRLRHGSSDSLHFLPTAAGYARYELNQLVYRLILMLILILILYSISPTPNRFFFLPKS